MIFNIILIVIAVGALVLYFVRKKKMKDQFAAKSNEDEIASDYDTDEEEE